MSAPRIAISAKLLIEPNSKSGELTFFSKDFFCFQMSLSIPISAQSTPERRNHKNIFWRVEISMGRI